MTLVDIAILVLVGLSALVGFFRGLIKEVFSLVNWAVALLVAFLFKGALAAVLPFGMQASPLIRELAASALLFFGTLTIGAILTHLLAQIVKATGLSGTDRTLGLCFGLARGFVIVLAILIFLPALMPVETESWWTSSLIIPGFLRFEGWARELLSAMFEWISSLFSQE